MDFLHWCLDFVQNMDSYLTHYFQEYGIIVYIILFLVIFCETGLVIAPFLPGDSLIFAAGAVAALGNSNVFVLFIVMFVAGILGNTTNYTIGRLIGQKIYEKNLRCVKKEYIDSAMNFFEQHGGIAIVITRFMPIMRTFTPFVAGIAKMRPSAFSMYNILGAFLWVASFLSLGYFFGQQPFVKQNLSMVMVAIVVISICPAIVVKLIDIYKKSKADK